MDTPRTPRQRITARAELQSGRIASWQLTSAGATQNQIDHWVRSGWLTRGLPRVYAVGAVVLQDERSALWEAVLYAGQGAMLSHLTAAHWRGLIRYPARDGIHVSTTRQIRSRKGIIVHTRRKLDLAMVRNVPVTRVMQTVLDLGAAGDERLVLRALSQLDYDDALDTAELIALTRRGRPGSAILKRAIAEYSPGYAQLQEGAETDFFELCRRAGLDPLPEVNVEIETGLIVDALFRDAGLVVEIDGIGNHGSPEQLPRDSRRDLRLRALGFTVVRYRAGQITGEPDLVVADLRAQLAHLRKAA